MIAAGLSLHFVSDLPFPRLVSELLLLFGLSILFVPIYYVFPDANLSLMMILPGAVVAALGGALLHAAFGVYVAYSSTEDLYGVLGGVVLLITFFYREQGEYPRL
ncbi:MAG: YhjD/YihY/BrkB family envelope integrity protein [Halorhabdus sp.]